MLVIAEWLKSITGSDSITAVDVAKFRVGSYADADNATKRKWCHVMLHFLPCVCSNYTKWDVKQKQAASVVSTPSDEALVLWILQCYVSAWHVELTIEPAAGRKRKQKGPHMSHMHLQLFKDMLDRVIAARKDSVTGSDWDLALMVEANHQNSVRESVGGFTDAIRAPAQTGGRQKIIMPYIRASKPGIVVTVTVAGTPV